jgi:hypothetical protein
MLTNSQRRLRAMHVHTVLPGSESVRSTWLQLTLTITQPLLTETGRYMLLVDYFPEVFAPVPRVVMGPAEGNTARGPATPGERGPHASTASQASNAPHAQEHTHSLPATTNIAFT